MSISVYPGSFDPFTSGHLDILKRAAKLFSEVDVAVLVNVNKHAAFSAQERCDMICMAVDAEGLNNVSVHCFNGLLVEYAAKVGAKSVIRGVRNGADMEYERQLEAVNRRLAPELETVYFAADPRLMHISSSIIKELCVYNQSIVGLVPDVIQNIIAERLKSDE